MNFSWGSSISTSHHKGPRYYREDLSHLCWVPVCPLSRVCAPPNLRAPSVCPVLYLLTAEPFLQGCLKTCLCHKPHLPLCPSTAPRKLGCMAVTCPPDFMMHVCSPWRNYRQVPSGRSSNISAHFQPEMSLQVRQRDWALVGCVHHRFIVFFKVKTKQQ